MSASSSRVARTLRLRDAASATVASIWRLIALRFSCWSFCSRGVIGFLSGFENESVVFQQGDGGGSEFVELRVPQSQGWLRPARRPLLTQDVGNIIGAESAGGPCFFDGAGHVLRAVLPHQFQQFLDLTAQGTICVGNTAEPGFHGGSRT